MGLSFLHLSEYRPILWTFHLRYSPHMAIEYCLRSHRNSALARGSHADLSAVEETFPALAKGVACDIRM